MVRFPVRAGIDRDHLFTQDRGPTVWVESHVVRGAGGLNRSPNSTSPTPGHGTHTLLPTVISAISMAPYINQCNLA
eukprot:jgi/Chrzof1/10388/Cz04g40040.t1